MHANQRTNTTLYSTHIQKMLEAAEERGFGLMTVRQFAHFAGVKPTHNLRRRLKQAKENGWIDIQQSYTDYNTLEHVIVFDRETWKDVPF